jgi:integrase
MPSIVAHKDGYRVHVYVKGVRDSGIFERKKDAQQWAARREQELRNTSTVGGHTFADAVDKYIKEVSTKKAGTHFEKLRLNAMLEYFGKTKLRDIGPPQIGAWRDFRLTGDDQHRPVIGSTVIREANLLGNLFSIAMNEWKWMEHHPFKGVTWPEDSESRHQVWRWQQIKRVMRKLGYVTGKPPETKLQQVAMAFMVELRTSLRAAEVLRVNKDTFDPVKRVIVVKAKGKLRSEIPVTPRGVRICKIAVQRPWTITSTSLDTLFRKARDETLCDDLTFHDGRATALTCMARRYDILTLSRISQHKDLKMLQRYYRETSADIAGRL